MKTALRSPFIVPSDKTFSISELRTAPEDPPSRDACKNRLKKLVKKLDLQQRKLYAQDNYSVLLIFQAMDAAGKDSTIRAVMRGVNPAGCQVFSFKQPGDEELDHDFLWRTSKRLPERGRIGIFNRSYYEEVLVVRVHPQYLGAQKLPEMDMRNIWKNRYDSIRNHERHLAENGTIILKFWLNVSKEEQKKRFISRIENKEKNWKFSEADLTERAHWDKYMHAYEEALKETSRPWAPWYAVPADNKPYMRMTVAEIIVDTLKKLDLNYPELDKKSRDRLKKLKKVLRE